jgi:hypothetical protein
MIMNTNKKLFTTLAGAFFTSFAHSQDPNPAYQHRVPDRVFEMGIPLFIILSFLYVIVLVFKIISDNKMKNRLIEKGISEETIKLLVDNGRRKLSLEALKWALIIGFCGIGLFINQYITFGFTSFAILFMCIAAALLTFYFTTKDK